MIYSYLALFIRFLEETRGPYFDKSESLFAAMLGYSHRPVIKFGRFERLTKWPNRPLSCFNGSWPPGLLIIITEKQMKTTKTKPVYSYVCSQLQRRRAFVFKAQVNTELLEKLDGAEEVGVIDFPTEIGIIAEDKASAYLIIILYFLNSCFQ